VDTRQPNPASGIFRLRRAPGSALERPPVRNRIEVIVKDQHAHKALVCLFAQNGEKPNRQFESSARLVSRYYARECFG
jgi:hypothetical protein